MQDNLVYTGTFKFDQDVTDCFDDMIHRSIPDYLTMRDYCQNLGFALLSDNDAPKIVDIGCSTGLSAVSFVNTYSEKGKFVLIDQSENMVTRCKSFYKDYDCDLEIKCQDISEKYDEKDVDLILSIFTLQFTPIAKRMDIMQNLYNSLSKGGAIILCEKILCNDTTSNNLFTEKYYDIKAKNGYNKQNIESKEESLKTVLYPMKYDWNIDMMKSVGFKHIDCFWRAWNFVGLVGIKE